MDSCLKHLSVGLSFDHSFFYKIVFQIHNDAAFRRLEDIVDFIYTDGNNTEYISQQEDVATMLMRFSTDGAKMGKNIDSVRGVVKPLIPRDRLPASVNEISMSPEDEYTLYLYMGKNSLD